VFFVNLLRLFVKLWDTGKDMPLVKFCKSLV